MTLPYYDSIQLIERLHRRFLDVLKVELDRHSVQDINNVQAMILYNIGNEEMTVGELTLRGYYLGSNVSYNVKKMVENDYLEQERSVHDKRSIRVKLTDKGQDICKIIDGMFDRHKEKIGETALTPELVTDMNKTLGHLERFWEHQTQFTGLSSLDDF